jgi:hypothetical protein
MRFVVELSRAEGGQVTGTVEAADAPPEPFLGWLDLLRRLEDGVEPPAGDDEVAG